MFFEIILLIAFFSVFSLTSSYLALWCDGEGIAKSKSVYIPALFLVMNLFLLISDFTILRILHSIGIKVTMGWWEGFAVLFWSLAFVVTAVFWLFIYLPLMLFSLWVCAKAFKASIMSIDFFEDTYINFRKSKQ